MPLGHRVNSVDPASVFLEVSGGDLDPAVDEGVLVERVTSKDLVPVHGEGGRLWVLRQALGAHLRSHG